MVVQKADFCADELHPNYLVEAIYLDSSRHNVQVSSFSSLVNVSAGWCL